MASIGAGGGFLFPVFINETGITISASGADTFVDEIAGSAVNVALSNTTAVSSAGILTASNAGLTNITVVSTAGSLTASNAGLTNITAVASAGILTASNAGLTNITAVSAAGNLTVIFSVALTNQTTVSSQGNATAVISVALTNQTTVSSQGNTTAVISIALTNQTTVSSQGNTTVVISVALTNQTSASSQGNVTVGIVLIGQASTSSQGIATTNNSIVLAGQSSTNSQGIIGFNYSTVPTNQTVNSGIGTLSITATSAILNISTASSQGTVSVSGNQVVALTGQASTSSIGNIGFNYSFVPAGQKVTTAGATILNRGAVGSFPFPVFVNETGTTDAEIAGGTFINEQSSSITSTLATTATSAILNTSTSSGQGTVYAQLQTVLLTGQQSTSSIGNLGFYLIGQTINSGIGALTAKATSAIFNIGILGSPLGLLLALTGPGAGGIINAQGVIAVSSGQFVALSSQTINSQISSLFASSPNVALIGQAAISTSGVITPLMAFAQAQQVTASGLHVLGGLVTSLALVGQSDLTSIGQITLPNVGGTPLGLLLALTTSPSGVVTISPVNQTVNSGIGVLSSTATSSIVLTGQITTSSIGTITTSTSSSIFELSMSSSRGIIVTSEIEPILLVGQTLTSGQGTINISETTTVNLSGLSISSSSGSIVANTGSIILLTNQSTNSQLTSLLISQNIGFAGQASLSIESGVVASITTFAHNQQITTSGLGVLGSATALALVGQSDSTSIGQLTSAAGTAGTPIGLLLALTLSGAAGTSVPMFNQSITTIQGSVHGILTLTDIFNQSVTSSQGSLGFNLGGQASLVGQGITASAAPTALNAFYLNSISNAYGSGPGGGMPNETLISSLNNINFIDTTALSNQTITSIQGTIFVTVPLPVTNGSSISSQGHIAFANITALNNQTIITSNNSFSTTTTVGLAGIITTSVSGIISPTTTRTFVGLNTSSSQNNIFKLDMIILTDASVLVSSQGTFFELTLASQIIASGVGTILVNQNLALIEQTIVSQQGVLAFGNFLSNQNITSSQNNIKVEQDFVLSGQTIISVGAPFVATQTVTGTQGYATSNLSVALTNNSIAATSFSTISVVYNQNTTLVLSGQSLRSTQDGAILNGIELPSLKINLNQGHISQDPSGTFVVILTDAYSTWTVPTNVTIIKQVEVWGAGYNNGGGGGAYSSSNNLSVTPGTKINYSVASPQGGDSFWNATSLAEAVANGPMISVGAQSGFLGRGGSNLAGVGQITHSGGSTAGGECGGGGAATSLGDGYPAVSFKGGTAGTNAGAGGLSAVNGIAGGNNVEGGGGGGAATAGTGGAGGIPGGGGGSGSVAGTGAHGQIRLRYIGAYLGGLTQNPFDTTPAISQGKILYDTTIMLSGQIAKVIVVPQLFVTF